MLRGEVAEQKIGHEQSRLRADALNIRARDANRFALRILDHDRRGGFFDQHASEDAPVFELRRMRNVWWIDRPRRVNDVIESAALSYLNLAATAFKSGPTSWPAALQPCGSSCTEPQR